MYLPLRSESFGNENQSWLGSARGTQSTRSGTLILSLFTGATHFPDGFLRSGQPLGKLTSGTGYDANVETFGPYTAGATNGTQTLAGFLFTSQAIPAGVTTGNVAAPILDTGRVIISLLPTSNSAVDGAAQATNPRFVYVANA